MTTAFKTECKPKTTLDPTGPLLKAIQQRACEYPLEPPNRFELAILLDTALFESATTLELHVALVMTGAFSGLFIRNTARTLEIERIASLELAPDGWRLLTDDRPETDPGNISLAIARRLRTVRRVRQCLGGEPR